MEQRHVCTELELIYRLVKEKVICICPVEIARFSGLVIGKSSPADGY